MRPAAEPRHRAARENTSTHATECFDADPLPFPSWTISCDAAVPPTRYRLRTSLPDAEPDGVSTRYRYTPPTTGRPDVSRPSQRMA